MSELFSEVAISSRIRLARNISGIEFMPALCDEFKVNFINSSMETLLQNLGSFTVMKLSDMPLSRCTALLERHVISKQLIENKDISLVGTNEDESLIVMVMEEDHIREQSISKGFSLIEAYNKLLPIDKMILDSFDIAYDDEFGFLTSSPSNLGTGMRASVMIFIPALEKSGRVGEIIKEAGEQSLTFRGMFGEGSSALGSIYQISNQGLMGCSEEEIIDRVSDFFVMIANEELSLRKHLFENNHDMICDEVFRAYGAITNAYVLEEDEMISLLSKLRFGYALGILKIRDEAMFMKLYYHGGSASLSEIRGFSNSEEENRVRAEYIAKRIKYLVTKGD